MLESEKPAFDVKNFLAGAGLGREIVELRENQILFAQGMAADSVIYLQSGRAKLLEILPVIGEDRLVGIIGTSKSAVSFFMNRFRELGFMSCGGRIQVHRSLLDVILHDRLPGNNAAAPEIVRPAS